MAFLLPKHFVPIVIRLITLAVCLLLSILPLAYAQVTTAITATTGAGNLGTTVTPAGTVHTITGGTRPGQGSNLFHSFGLFSVGATDTANFLNNTGLPTSNILSRVTGGLPSQIFGTIRTTGFPGANLFLMNPAGVVFGPTASLNVEGSFHVTTSDYLRFADNAKFFVNDDATHQSVLSVAPVIAFGFTNPTPAPISLQGSQLTMRPGQSFSIIAGDVQAVGTQVSTPAGLIQVASVASPGEVVLGIPGLAPDPLDVSSFNRLGRTEIQLSALDASGTPEAPVGGAILIRSGQLVMENAALLSQTAVLDGGPISLGASDIEMSGGLIQTATVGPGAGGDVLITTGMLSLSTGALISSQAVPNPLLPGEGQGGNIQIRAVNSVSVSDQRPGQFQFIPGLASYLNMPSGVYSDTYTGAKSGSILIETPRLSLQTGIVSSHTFGAGSAGNISLNVGSLIMRDGGQVSTNSFGAGPAGIVRITAAESINIAGHFPGESGIGPLVTNDLSSGVYAGSFVTGPGGGVEITTPSLTMNDGQIASNTVGSGTGGDIVLNAGRLVLTGGANISTIAFGDGSGGNITVNATDSVTMSGQSDTAFTFGTRTFPSGRPSGFVSTTDGAGAGGAITVRTGRLVQEQAAVIEAFSNELATGKAGDINMEVGSATLSGGALITSTTLGAGAAGNVSVRAADSIELLGETPGPMTIGPITFPHVPSNITSTTLGSGEGGEVTVSARTLIQERGIIDVESFGSGNAGSVTVNVGELQLRDGAFIGAAATGAGTGGSLTVTATESIFIDGFRTDTFPSGNTQLINPNSTITTNSYGTGKAGIISVTTPLLSIGEGKGGGQIGANSFGIGGAAGEITLDVGRLTLRNGGSIIGVTLVGGEGGNITIRASDSISISGHHPSIFGAAGVIFDHIQSDISTLTLGSGKAGRITVSTPQLDLHDAGLISAATGSQGAAGNVAITAANINISTGGQISSSSGVRIGNVFALGTGAGGTVNVTTGRIQLDNGAAISASSFGLGDAGNINITAADQVVMRDSAVTTQATVADGGNIEIHAVNLVQLVNSSITTSVGTGSGNGGNITIDPRFVVLDHSQVIANAFGGNGGNISITSGVFLVDPSSIVNASSALGVNGVVAIQSPVQNLSGTLSPLPASLLKIAPLTSACAARAQGGSMSSFTVAGRDGVPAEPGGLLPSPLQQASLASDTGTQAATSSQPGLPLPILLAMNRESPCND